MLKKTFLLSSSIFIAASIAMPAQAQVEDEIIVTATKRETTLQETPVAVTVTNADTMEKAQILDIKDLQSVVPTMRVSQLQNAMNTTITIRGFGNGGNNIGIEPAVGMFVDGVYRSRAAAQIGDLPNLERIEVLSGPQSTLFGKNASAGVVSVVTAAPSFDTQGYIEGSLGNYAYNAVKAYITGAVSENTAISLGGGYQKRDGYFDSQTDQADDMNDLSRFNFRGQALWQPTDDFSLRVIADMSSINENCCGTGVALEGPLNGVSGATARNVINSLGGDQPSADDQFSYESYLNRDTDNEIDAKGISAQIDYDWNGYDFTSITAMRKTEADYDSDSDFNSLELLENTYQYVDIDTFTQELRLTGEWNRASWLLGGFYFNETISQDSGLIYGDNLRSYFSVLGAGLTGNTPAGIESTFQLLEATNGHGVGTTYFAGGTVMADDFSQDDEAFSIFGTVDFEVTDKLTLTGGLNYTKDEKSVVMSTNNQDAFSNLDLAGDAAANALPLATVAGLTPTFAQICGLDSTAGLADIAGAAACNAALLPPTFGLPSAVIPGSIIVSPTTPGTGAIFSIADGIAGATNLTNPCAAGESAPTCNPFLGFTAFQFQPQFLAFPNSVERGKTSDDNTTWTARLAYELNENWNFYGSAATGFKASSWNLTRDSRPFLADATALTNDGLLPNNYVPSTGRNFGTRFAEPEESTVYELGVKARYEDWAFNLALFDQTIENFQSTIFQGTGFVLANAGEQSTTGIEFDGKWTPMEPLTLTLAATLLDPVYDEFVGAPGPAAPGFPNGTVVDLSGEKPAGIPEASISTSATYNHMFANGIEAFIRGDYLYQSEVQVVDNIVGVDRKVSTFNGSLGAEFENGVSLRLWGRNLFNDEYYTSAFPGVVQFFTSNVYPNQPRTYGVSLRKNF